MISVTAVYCHPQGDVLDTGLFQSCRCFVLERNISLCSKSQDVDEIVRNIVLLYLIHSMMRAYCVHQRVMFRSMSLQYSLWHTCNSNWKLSMNESASWWMILIDYSSIMYFVKGNLDYQPCPFGYHTIWYFTQARHIIREWEVSMILALPLILFLQVWTKVRMCEGHYDAFMSLTNHSSSSAGHIADGGKCSTCT